MGGEEKFGWIRHVDAVIFSYNVEEDSIEKEGDFLRVIDWCCGHCLCIQFQIDSFPTSSALLSNSVLCGFVSLIKS